MQFYLFHFTLLNDSGFESNVFYFFGDLVVRPMLSIRLDKVLVILYYSSLSEQRYLDALDTGLLQLRLNGGYTGSTLSRVSLTRTQICDPTYSHSSYS